MADLGPQGVRKMLEYYRFKQINDLFSKGQFENARRELAELQRRYVAICDENTTYRIQIQEYEDALYLARNLFNDGEFYWLITGSIKQGPFCPECYNRDGLLMRLAGEWEERCCPSCRTPYPKQEEELSFTAAAIPQERQHMQSMPAIALQKRQKVLQFRR